MQKTISKPMLVYFKGQQFWLDEKPRCYRRDWTCKKTPDDVGEERHLYVFRVVYLGGVYNGFGLTFEAAQDEAFQSLVRHLLQNVYRADCDVTPWTKYLDPFPKSAPNKMEVSFTDVAAPLTIKWKNGDHLPQPTPLMIEFNRSKAKVDRCLKALGKLIGKVYGRP